MSQPPALTAAGRVSAHAALPTINQAGRLAPFMLGLLVAVASFSAYVKANIERQLLQVEATQRQQATAAAADLKQALTLDLLLEDTVSYSNTITLARAQKYLASSSGVTASNTTPIANIKTGDTEADLASQRALLSPSADSGLNTEIAALANADSLSTFASSVADLDLPNRLPQAVFDSVSVRRLQLNDSLDALDQQTAAVLAQARALGRLPTAAEFTGLQSLYPRQSSWGQNFTYTYTSPTAAAMTFRPPWDNVGTTTDDYTINLALACSIPTTHSYNWASASLYGTASPVATASPAYGSATHPQISAHGGRLYMHEGHYNHEYDLSTALTLNYRFDLSAPANSGRLQARVSPSGQWFVTAANLSNTGTLSFYRRQGDAHWQLMNTLTSANLDPFDLAWAPTSDRLYLLNRDTGTTNDAVRVYRLNTAGSAWEQVASHRAPNMTFVDGFPSSDYGAAMDVDEGHLVVGQWDTAPSPDDGRAFVFKVLNSAPWLAFQQELNPATADATSDECGVGVTVDGGIIVVGCPGDTNVAGQTGTATAYVLNRFQQWVPFQRFGGSTGSVSGWGDRFGSGLMLRDGTLITASRYTSGQKHMEIFQLTCSGFTPRFRVTTASYFSTSIEARRVVALSGPYALFTDDSEVIIFKAPENP